MENMEKILQVFMGMTFVGSLEFVGIALILSVILFSSIYLLIWWISQVIKLFRNIIS